MYMLVMVNSWRFSFNFQIIRVKIELVEFESLQIEKFEGCDYSFCFLGSKVLDLLIRSTSFF